MFDKLSVHYLFLENSAAIVKLLAMLGEPADATAYGIRTVQTWLQKPGTNIGRFLSPADV
jgi:hypothetical protein